MNRDEAVSEVRLAPSWILTTEHAQSSDGMPLLVNGQGEAFGPAELIQPYPSGGYMLAAAAVARMAKTREMSDAQRQFVESFGGPLLAANARWMRAAKVAKAKKRAAKGKG